MLVAVALPVPLRTTFTYEVPAALRAIARRGCRVRVRFGKRTSVGIILGPADAPPEGQELRAIDAVLDEEPLIPEPVLKLAEWIAAYYQAPIGEAMKLALPPAGKLGRVRSENEPGPPEHDDHDERDAPDAETLVRLSPATESAAPPLDRRASRLRAVLDTLAASSHPEGWVRIADLRRSAGAERSVLDKLAIRGLIEIARTSRGTENGSAPSAPVPPPPLTPAQSAAARPMLDAIDKAEASVFVLRGITGSGKTEVYFHAARRALDRGRGVIFLVPEIALTPVFTRRVRERFGDQVAVLHSALTARDRASAWERVRIGAAPLVVGPRSALFAPVTRLGLIVVDEEHDGSYKQEESPRYHARDMALVRAKLEGAPAVLGSATPSLETWHAANTGRHVRLELTERIANRPLPLVEIVDMREEFRKRGAPVLLSQPLRDAVILAKSQGEQAVILLNRRGYAAFALCRACGEPIGCPQCSVSLVYHRSSETLRCHYCDHHRPRPEKCPTCGSEHLVFQGEGTERIERHLERELPGLRVARLDRDTARARGAHERILSQFEAGAFDVLVGTQMVAKGHDFPAVTVVGVLAADATLGFPDFRAAERTFQLLTQVAGRAGRGDRPGRVLIQAYRREHYALQTAIHHDHEAFSLRELQYRKILGYPPFASLAAITVQNKDLAAAASKAKQFATLIARIGAERVQVLGPALAPLARLRGLYRLQVLVKARTRGRMGDVLRRAIEETSQERGALQGVIVDVDPQQLL